MFGDGNMQTVSFVFTAESEVRKKKDKNENRLCNSVSLPLYERAERDNKNSLLV